MRDQDTLDAVLRESAFDAVLHFAARSIVPESMKDPCGYFENNVAGTVALLNGKLARGTNRVVFSSTAAVYGVPHKIPLPEDTPLHPNNPYGASKAMVEEMLAWYHTCAGLRYAALRYFNAAGASERFGEDHSPETHLIPLALDAVLGRGPELTVFGDNYPTADGTAVRDYIHVLDLAEAHVLALESLDTGPGRIVCNLGNEAGYSVLQVLAAVREVTGAEVPMRMGSRRAGDASVTVAATAKAREIFSWRAARGLHEMVESAWRWRLRYPGGYGRK
jgi:UDP-glucose 4-epimerase